MVKLDHRDEVELIKVIERLQRATDVMRRNTAMMQLQIPGSPYNRLVRVMIKLKLVRDWHDPF